MQRILAYHSGISRCRRLLRRGLQFHGTADLTRHFRRLLEDPWVTGSDTHLGRAERRASRLRPPTRRPGVTTYCSDGAARGQGDPRDRDPEAACGAVLLSEDGTVAAKCGTYLGPLVTNNVAEYEALILGLERAVELGARRVEVRADSQLLVKQMRGEYRINSSPLRACARRARELVKNFETVEYVHIRRHLNEEADRLANLAIDEA